MISININYTLFQGRGIIVTLHVAVTEKNKPEVDISTPLNVRHVGMQNMDQFTNPLAGRSNFPVEVSLIIYIDI